MSFPQAARRYDDFRHTPDVNGVDSHGSMIDGMIEHVAVGVDIMAEHIADGSSISQALDILPAEYSAAENRSLCADVADAQQRDIDRARAG